MLSYVGGCVLLAALLHAAWNAMLHGNRDRFWSMTWMSVGVTALSLVAVNLLPRPAREAWPYIVASGLVHIVYNMLLVRAYQSGDLGEAYPIARGSSPLLVALGAALFARESLGVAQVAGVVLVSCGIIALALGRRRLAFAGTVTALSTGATIAVYTVIDGIGVRLSGHAAAYTSWIFLFYGLMPVVFVAARGRQALWAPLRDTVTSMGGGVVSFAAYGIVIWAMQFGAMGAVSALRETSVVFAALLGRLFLKERLTPKRLMSCCVIALGAILLGA